MSITSKKVQLSFLHGEIKRLLQLGSENRLHSRNGSLQKATICYEIIKFMINLFRDPEVVKYLKTHGGTFLDLILRAVHKYVKSA